MKSASKHWSLQRLSSLPLIPISLYFATQLEFLTTKSRMEFVAWAGQSVTTACLVIFIACAFYHARLGMEEIVTDYIHTPKQKAFLLFLNRFFFFSLGAMSILAVLTLHFGKF